MTTEGAACQLFMQMYTCKEEKRHAQFKITKMDDIENGEERLVSDFF